MQLSTFGALLRFAMEVERKAEEVYAKLTFRVASTTATELFTRYAKEHTRRLRYLEEIRQRNINEMLLEPISNMDDELYMFPTIGEIMDVKKALLTAHEMETRIFAFYADSQRVAGAALGEAGRAFKKLSEENADRRKTLSSLLADCGPSGPTR